MSAPLFPETRVAAVREAADRAVTFLERHDFPLGAAWVLHRWHDGPEHDVLEALSAYQQPDGGFSGLEVDIKAPVSNAFAGRHAMQVLLSLRTKAFAGIAEPLGRWYARTQHDDGDWHFPPQVHEHGLAPWFRAWRFPSLNPACSVAGHAHALGIATPEKLARVARLWDARATHDQARSGQFYEMLPIVEYVAHIDVPDRDTWLDALAEGIERGVAANSFEDAEHALEHIAGGGPDLVARLDRDLVERVIAAALLDQRDDGGWPTPYDLAWRPWVTAHTLVNLSKLYDWVV